MNYIRGFKLITGEDVVAEVLAGGGGVTNLKNPVLIVVQPGVGGGAQLSFAPFPPFSKESKTKEVTLRNDHVVYIYEVQQEILNGYNSLFGSGLVVPNLSFNTNKR